MWGCLRWIGCGTIGLFALILIILGGGWWYLGTSSFSGLVKLRIEKTLEARLEWTGRQAGQVVGGAVGPQPGRQRLAHVLREQQAKDRQGTLLPAVGTNETESSATKSPWTGPG